MEFTTSPPATPRRQHMVSPIDTTAASPTNSFREHLRRRTSSFSSNHDRSPVTPRSRHRFSKGFGTFPTPISRICKDPTDPPAMNFPLRLQAISSRPANGTELRAQASSLTEASRVEMLPAFADLGRRGATCLCGKASNSGMVSGLPGQTYVF